jgi:hypothetical protein
MEAALAYEAVLFNPPPEVKTVKPPRKGNGRSWYSIVFSRINDDTFTSSKEILTGLNGEERRRVLVALIAMTKKGYIERRGKYHEYEYRNLTPNNCGASPTLVGDGTTKYLDTNYLTEAL